jgi:hypothetical protein
MIKDLYDPVMDMVQKSQGGKLNISGIARELGTTREWVNVMLAESKRRKMNG